MRITDDIVEIGCDISKLHPEMVLLEEFHYINGPTSYIFRIGDDSQKFHVELVQSFRDDASLWMVTEYYGELDDVEFKTNVHLRTRIMNLISMKDHKILIVNHQSKIMHQKFSVNGSYPYSVFDALYHAKALDLGKPSSDGTHPDSMFNALCREKEAEVRNS